MTLKFKYTAKPLRRRKTTVYLDEPLLRSMKQLAYSQGVSEAWLVREAVTEYVTTASKAAGRRTPRSLGFASGPGNLSERADDLLAAGFGRDHADR
jgi:hypothetical protein